MSIPLKVQESCLRQNLTQKARAVSPDATAGTCGIPAPRIMSEAQLRDQALRLVNKVIVYEVKGRGDEDVWTCHAGTICVEGNVSSVRCSAANNHLDGVTPVVGDDCVFRFPDPDYRYRRIMEASVWQTERATMHLDEQRRQNAELSATVRRQGEQLSQLLARQEVVCTTPAAASKGASLVSGCASTAAAALDVKFWAGVIEDDRAGDLLLALEMRYCAGLRHGTGGDLLGEHFDNVREWVLSAGDLEGWYNVASFVLLGNRLLEQLRIQQLFCTERLSRAEIRRELAAKSDDALGQTAAVLVARRKRVGSARFRPGGSSSVSSSGSSVAFPARRLGNGKAGGH